MRLPISFTLMVPSLSVSILLNTFLSASMVLSVPSLSPPTVSLRLGFLLFLADDFGLIEDLDYNSISFGVTSDSSCY